MREQVAETQRNLPLRLRIFEKFPYVCLLSVIVYDIDTAAYALKLPQVINLQRKCLSKFNDI